MSTYVLSDIHGRYQMFKDMLKKIDFKDVDTMYILGDVIDRGDESIKALRYIFKQPNIKLLMGNHEKFMVDYFNFNYMSDWFYNGGSQTYDEIVKYGQEEVERLIGRCANLPLTLKVEVNGQTYRLCHAGLQYKDGYYVEKQNKDFVLWARREFYGETYIEDDIVLFGHTPTPYLNDDRSSNIWHGENMIGMDCGATFGYKLGCLRLDDMEEFYIDHDEKKH